MNITGTIRITDMTKDEYLALRKELEQYQWTENISGQLTEEDYKAFDRNFDIVMDTLTYREKPSDADCIDEARAAMEALGQPWFHSNFFYPTNEEFIDTIRTMYKGCLEQGTAKARVEGGGLVVATDILDHKVLVQFGTFNEYADDDDTGR